MYTASNFLGNRLHALLFYGHPFEVIQVLRLYQLANGRRLQISHTDADA
jgi:hypothetical protein